MRLRTHRLHGTGALLFLILALVAATRQVSSQGAALPDEDCGKWAIQHVATEKPAFIEISDLGNESITCLGAFRLRGAGNYTFAGASTLSVANASQNVRVEWVPSGLPGEVNPTLLPPLEYELQVLPEDPDLPGSATINVTSSAAAFSAGWAYDLLGNAVNLLPPQNCDIPEKQLASVALRLTPMLEPTTRLLFAGKLTEIRMALLETAPRLFKGAADNFGDSGLVCAEAHFRRLAVRAELIERATAASQAWIPLAIFDLLEGQRQSELVRLTYAPALQEASYRVTGVSPNDVLNIRTNPGIEYLIIGTIPPDGVGIRLIGPINYIGPSRWVLIVYQGTTGWVNFRFLEPE